MVAHRPGGADLAPVSRMGVPVGVRASLSLALAARPLRRRPRLRAGAAERSRTSRSARLGRAHGRDVLLARPARLPAGARAARAAARPHRRAPRDRPRRSRDAAAVRFPGRLRARAARDRPRALRARRRSSSSIVVELAAERAPAPARASCASSREQPGWEARAPAHAHARLAARRRSRATCAGRMRVRTARTRGAPAPSCCRAASIFVPAADGPAAPRRSRHRRQACAIAAPPGRAEQPELAAAETARLVEDEDFRARRSRREPRRGRSRRPTAGARRRSVERDLRARAASRRRRSHRRRRRPLRGARLGSSPTFTCTRAWSHDCSIDVEELARPRRGPGARCDRGHRPQRLRRRAGGGRSAPVAAS